MRLAMASQPLRICPDDGLSRCACKVGISATSSYSLPSVRSIEELLDMGLLRICTDHHFVSQHTSRAWVNHGQPLHHFFHDIFGTVHELFHDKATVQRRIAGPFSK